MANMKVGLHFYLTAAVLTKVLQKCSLSSPLPNIRILSKPLNLIWNLSFIAIRLCRYFDKSFTEFLCSLSSPLLTLSILSKLLNLIGCHGNRKAKFAKIFGKIIFSEALREMKLKLRRNVHNISLYKILFFIVVVHVLSLLRQIKVSIDL